MSVIIWQSSESDRCHYNFTRSYKVELLSRLLTRCVFKTVWGLNAFGLLDINKRYYISLAKPVIKWFVDGKWQKNFGHSCSCNEWISLYHPHKIIMCIIYAFWNICEVIETVKLHTWKFENCLVKKSEQMKTILCFRFCIVSLLSHFSQPTFMMCHRTLCLISLSNPPK